MVRLMTRWSLFPSFSRRRRFGAAMGMAALFMQMVMILGQALPSSTGARDATAETGLAALNTTPLVICLAYGADSQKEDGNNPLSKQETCPVCLTHALGHTLMTPSGVQLSNLSPNNKGISLGPIFSQPIPTFGPRRPPSHAPPSFV